MKTFKLSDRYELASGVYGNPKGTSVIFINDISGSRLIRNLDESLTTLSGIRAVAANQPGVGGPSPMKSFKMVDRSRI